jgi:hypothetical protein
MRDMRRFGEALADIGIAGKLGGKSGRIEAADVDRAWRDAGCNPMSQTELAKYEKFAQERAGD